MKLVNLETLENTNDQIAGEAESATNVTFLTAEEVAQRYRSSTNRVYQWARDGHIPQSCVMRIGRKLLFNAAGLSRWEAEGGPPVGHDDE